MKKSFSEKLKFGIRKLAISLKRNYFIIPLIFIFVTVFVIMCSLVTISSSINRASASPAQPFDAYGAVFVFLFCLFSILGGVAYINYANVGYGKKRPTMYMIIFIVLFAICIGCEVIAYLSIKHRYDLDVVNYNQAVANNNQQDIQAYLDAMPSEVETMNALIGQIVLLGISIVLVATAPFIQACLKKIKFKSISTEDKESDVVEEVVESK